MSSVAVPKKMVPAPLMYGVEAFKEIKPEIVALHPVQHKDTTFTTSAQNRISFRVPAYSNALMDTARSFLYVQASAFREGSNTMNKLTETNYGFDGACLAQGAPIFSRMVVKTSAGLTLEDVTDLDVLSSMLEVLRPMDTQNSAIYGNLVRAPYADKAAQHKGAGRLPAAPITVATNNGTADLTGNWETTSATNSFDTADTERKRYKELLVRFNFGIFGKTLSKFLPLFMADGGAGYSFDVDLYLSDRGLHATTDTTTAFSKLAIRKPVWYMHLMRMDEGLARRFNTMAVHGEEIRIPFTTYHTHRTTIQSGNMLAYIHENATNFKKILTCIHYADNVTGKLVTETDKDTQTRLLSGLTGGRGPGGLKVKSYNYRVGVQHVYNEPVAESVSNFRTLEFVRGAFGIPDGVVTLAEVPDYGVFTANSTYTTPFDKARWCSVASFDYTPGDNAVIQGISTSNPVELSLQLDDWVSGTHDTGNPTLLNFCEIGYDLVFKGGAIHYEEQKPGSQSVY